MNGWLQLAIGIVAPALLGHAVWATIRILRHDQTLYGEQGADGLKGDVKDLAQKWRHDLANKIQEPISRLYVDLHDDLERLEKRIEKLEHR